MQKLQEENPKLLPLTDKSIMPFGIWQGLILEKVPANYLIGLLESNELKKHESVKSYILQNQEDLVLEIKQHINKL